MPKNVWPLLCALLFAILLVLAVKYLNYPESLALGAVMGSATVLVLNWRKRRQARRGTAVDR
jgi:uncharacterized membrane protein